MASLHPTLGKIRPERGWEQEARGESKASKTVLGPGLQEKPTLGFAGSRFEGLWTGIQGGEEGFFHAVDQDFAETPAELSGDVSGLIECLEALGFAFRQVDQAAV